MKKKHYYLVSRDNGLLAGCDYSKQGNRTGFFYNTFVDPMEKILHWLGSGILIMIMV